MSDIRHSIVEFADDTAAIGEPVRVTLVEGGQGRDGTDNVPDAYTLVAVSNWTQAHGKPYLPDVRLVDPANRVVLADVTFPDSAHVNLSFPTPFTGTVFVR